MDLIVMDSAVIVVMKAEKSAVAAAMTMEVAVVAGVSAALPMSVTTKVRS